MSAARNAYRVIRSILFAAIIIVAAIYVGLYVVISIPGVQSKIKERIEKEAGAFLGGKVEIGDFAIFPFNEVRLHDTKILSPDGKECIAIERLGGGIHLWKLISEKRVVITYLEIIGLKGKIYKASPESPLNIDFIIKAFAPKDKNKPPTQFDVVLHNVVIRKSSVSYDMQWIPQKENTELFDPSHIYLSELCADISLPKIKTDDFEIDLRRLSFKEKSGFELEKIRCKAFITQNKLSLKDFSLRLPDTQLEFDDINLTYPSLKNIKQAWIDNRIYIGIHSQKLTPSDFRCFLPILNNFNNHYTLAAGISGNINGGVVESFHLTRDAGGFNVELEGEVNALDKPSEMTAELRKLNLSISSELIAKMMPALTSIGNESCEIIARQGDINAGITGEFNAKEKRANAVCDIYTQSGDILANADLDWESRQVYEAHFSVSSNSIDVNNIVEKVDIADLAIEAKAHIEKRGEKFDAIANASIPHLTYSGKTIENIQLEVSKHNQNLQAYVSVDDNAVALTASGQATLQGEESQWSLTTMVENLDLGMLSDNPKIRDYDMEGNVELELSGNKPDNFIGTVNLEAFRLKSAVKPEFDMHHLRVSSQKEDSLKIYSIDCDYLTADIRGEFTFKNIANCAANIAYAAMPSFISNNGGETGDDWALCNINIKPEQFPSEFLKLPIKPYDEVKITASIDGKTSTAFLSIDAPYLVKGTNKLIRDTHVALNGNATDGIQVTAASLIPQKNDEANFNLKLTAFADALDTDIGWKFIKNKTAVGEAGFTAQLNRDTESGNLDIDMNVKPTSFHLNGSEWKIGEAALSYADKAVSVKDLRIWHDKQFVNISGEASADNDHELSVQLADIDLSYIFEALNINYVTFGGYATGDVSASQLFSKAPVLRTKKLEIKDFSYNGTVLGDGKFNSYWDNEEKMVALNADIRDKQGGSAKVDGGIYVTRDSLSLNFDTHKLNIGFLQPFMEAFTSDVGGRASGKAKLYGTFKNIDLVGKIFADSLYMKVDYSNVYYHGSDSVIMTSGLIDIPGFRLYDRNGNSAMFRGQLKHDYFHRPEFDFKLTDVRNLLCYDTNRFINPDWYGTLYASGTAQLRGRPGIVSLTTDLTTSPNSDFTFVLSETQTAADYTFLTFSDHRKEALEQITGTVNLVDRFQKEIKQETQSKPSVFSMDLRCSVTPGAKMNLIMDPVAGDKIQARGQGPLQISYDTETDEMKIYGKYTLEEGNYNFSLQDLILRDFKIKEGSNISFNGDPLQALLDITAAYRVNTNLSDLDKSFQTDRDLNRTNVPVDALLMVRGDMRNPEISFDISLPTLTQDVERKVKSIVSTEDMLNRQIIYLLALNRFYTPEYMGNTSNGGAELASVASSTLSSQLSNMLGQLTDKVTLSPSFRSDKGDFSDMEVDVALSSRLLNNRLLINGNFGYRDRSTSTTTFVGDFDIEYLLNKNGDLRLKAYNHFNDQYYYLKSALTTQGIGVVYRHDFDNPFTFLKRRKKKDAGNQSVDKEKKQTPSDTIRYHDEKKRDDSEKRDSTILEQTGKTQLLNFK